MPTATANSPWIMSRHSRMTRTALSPLARRSATDFGSTTSRPSLRARVELRTIRLAAASSCASAARATSRSYSTRGSTARSPPPGVWMNWTLLFAVPVFAMVSLSVVNFAAVSDRVNCDGVGFDRKQHAPVTGAQPHCGYAFERFHVADASFRERGQFEVDLRTRSSAKFAPLADGGGRELNLFHGVTIA